MATQAVPAVATADSYEHSYEHTERIVYAIFMIVSPLILLVATIVHPKHGIGKRTGRSTTAPRTTTRPGSTLRTRGTS
jgi:hypothetical protein